MMTSGKIADGLAQWVSIVGDGPRRRSLLAAGVSPVQHEYCEVAVKQ